MSNGIHELAKNVDWEMGRRDFKYFFEDICGKHENYMVADFHQEWFDMSENHNKTCVIASRDHGKSVFYRVYLLWKMAYNRHRSPIFLTQSTPVNRTHG